MDILITKAVSDSDFNKISQLGNKIWREHYTSILGENQVNYMLNKFQNQKDINYQYKKEGFEYYMSCKDYCFVEYSSIKSEENETIFLSTTNPD